MAEAKAEKSKDSSKGSGLAVAGLVLAIIGLLLSAIPIINNFAAVLAVLGLIFGIIGAVKSKRSKATATVAIILSVIALIIVIASQAFYGHAVDQVGQEINNSINDSTGKNTDKILKNDLTVQLGKFSASKDQYDVWTTELPVTLTNKLDQQASYSVEIEAVDSNNKRLATDTVTSSDLAGRQGQDFKAFQFVDSAKIPQFQKADFKVLSASKY